MHQDNASIELSAFPFTLSLPPAQPHVLLLHEL